MGRNRSAPSHKEEDALFAHGYVLVAGADEVGRGPLAGPVVAAVVALPKKLKGKWVGLVRDSKQLSAPQREYVFSHLQETALSVGIGLSESHEIDKIGIVKATRLGMMRALDSMPHQPQYLLLDAFPLPEALIPQKPIIHGDALCTSIAAASIVAKVFRDRLMVEQDDVYPVYGFRRHKGYGTRKHLDNLRLHGPCPIHRRSYAPVREMLNGSHV